MLPLLGLMHYTMTTINQMHNTNINEIEALILQEIIKVEAQIQSLEKLTKPIAPENAIGRVSRMDAINNKSVNMAALQKARLKHKNLQIALSNLKEPSFGICAKCKNTIPIGRIMLMPQSRFCVNCAS